MSKNTFPEGFLWGVATSSHQVEGGNTNDWSEWEKSGKVKNGDISGKAADHWNRYEEDFDLLEELNLNSYRFSIEWSRIEPKKGEFDKKAVAHYRKMLESLKRRNITPMVTLHHFTNPLWLPDWTHQENVDHFVSYVTFVVEQLGDLVEYWCTVNEPVNVALLAYSGNIWPPQYSSPLKGLKAIKVFAKAHNKSYGVIHELHKSNKWEKPMVGIPVSIPYMTPARNKILDKWVNSIARKLRNNFFLKRVVKNNDFIGLNYYHTLHVKWNSPASMSDIGNDGLNFEKNDMGWNIEPEGLYHTAMQLYNRFGQPIIVTENGIADSKDRLRKWYIREHLKQLSFAVDKGVDVRGYIHWSLLDNFEWADGYTGRFGLVAVDFETQKRTVRESAWAYADIAKANQVPDDFKDMAL